MDDVIDGERSISVTFLLRRSFNVFFTSPLTLTVRVDEPSTLNFTSPSIRKPLGGAAVVDWSVSEEGVKLLTSTAASSATGLARLARDGEGSVNISSTSVIACPVLLVKPTVNSSQSSACALVSEKLVSSRVMSSSELLEVVSSLLLEEDKSSLLLDVDSSSLLLDVAASSLLLLDESAMSMK